MDPPSRAKLTRNARDAPRYGPGFLAVVITSVVAALLAIVYRYVCVWENRKRDKAGTMENYDNGKFAPLKPLVWVATITSADSGIAYDDDLTDKKVNSQYLQLERYRTVLTLYVEPAVQIHTLRRLHLQLVQRFLEGMEQGRWVTSDRASRRQDISSSANAVNVRIVNIVLAPSNSVRPQICK
jgi:hypothetical protein